MRVLAVCVCVGELMNELDGGPKDGGFKKHACLLVSNFPARLSLLVPLLGGVLLLSLLVVPLLGGVRLGRVVLLLVVVPLLGGVCSA